MKFLLTIFLTILGTFSSGQDIEKIFSAIGQGDIVSLSFYLDDQVELSFDNKTEILNKKSAEESLKNFFGKWPPANYEHMHQVDSRSKDSFYTIGKLVTHQKRFRVSIYLVKKQGSLTIQELKFESSTF